MKLIYIQLLFLLNVINSNYSYASGEIFEFLDTIDKKMTHAQSKVDRKTSKANLRAVQF